jgi:hypothetical protein
MQQLAVLVRISRGCGLTGGPYARAAGNLGVEECQVNEVSRQHVLERGLVQTQWAMIRFSRVR